MVSFSSINGTKLHGSSYWINQVLRTELNFKGIVISDWAGVDQVNTNYAVAVRTAINAGIDMVMVPDTYKNFITTLENEVLAGNVAESRIDDAVDRILKIKKTMQLYEQPLTNRTNFPASIVGSAAHRQLARSAAAKSVVLLKNDLFGGKKVLPLSKNAKYVIQLVGKTGDNIGLQCGGWTITWQGGYGATTEGVSILQGIRSKVTSNVTVNFVANAKGTYTADVGIAAVGEAPYAEGNGDSTTLALPSADADVIKGMCSKVRVCIVVLITGRPLIIKGLMDSVPNAAVWMAAWLPGSQGGEAIADLLFGDAGFTGKLPMTWPATVAQEPINTGDSSSNVPHFAYNWRLEYSRGDGYPA